MNKEMRFMKRAGKTFYFASFWLDKAIRNEAAIAYNFCRLIDDIADERPERASRNNELLEVINSIQSMEDNSRELTGIINLINKYPEIKEPVLALVSACLNDNPQLEITTTLDLERHAFGVAGNVGLIMYPILGGKNPVGKSFAAELGMAMQYTNIARDVLTDFVHQRVYLPTDWLNELDLSRLSVEEISSNQKVLKGVSKLLELANHKYQLGLSGLSYLSSDSQYAIRVAGECYQAIGNGVIKNHKLVQRSIVPLYKKLFLVISHAVKSAKKRELALIFE